MSVTAQAPTKRVDRPKRVQLCPHCASPRSAHGTHIATCATKSDEERAHFRKFFRWPNGPRKNYPDSRRERLTLAQYQELTNAVEAGERGVRWAVFHGGTRRQFEKLGLVEVREVLTGKRVFVTPEGVKIHAYYATRQGELRRSAKGEGR